MRPEALVSTRPHLGRRGAHANVRPRPPLSEILGDVLGGRGLAGAGDEGFLGVAEGQAGEVEVVVMTVAAINRSLRGRCIP